MIDVGQFRERVIRPTLVGLELWSEAAEALLIGTAVQESRLTYLVQIGGGPALGVYQLEPETEADIWVNFLRYRRGLARRIEASIAEIPPAPYLLVTDLRYATAMARIHYLRQREPLPAADDVEGLAHYWKDHYNTAAGKGTVAQFTLNYRRYVLGRD